MSLLPIIRRLLVSGEDQAEEAKRRLRERMLLGGVGPVPLGGNQVLTRNATTPYLSGNDTPLIRRTDPNAPIPVDPYVRPDITSIIRQPTPLDPIAGRAPGSLLDPNSPTNDPNNPLVVYNSKSRPTGVEGGGDLLTRNVALQEAQQGYKAPFSWKDFGLSALQGFLGGGLPGVASNTLGYGLNQDVRNQMSMGGDIANTQQQIGGELARRKTISDLARDDATTQEILRRPNVEQAKQAAAARTEESKQAEAERDNIRQIYNALPYFDADKNPQHKAIAERAEKLRMVLPNRPEKKEPEYIEVVNPRTGLKERWIAKDGKPVGKMAVAVEARDGSWVSPNTQYLADRGLEREGRADERVLAKEDRERSDEAIKTEAQNAADREKVTLLRNNADIYTLNADTEEQLAAAQDESTYEGAAQAQAHRAEAARLREDARQARTAAGQAERDAKSRVAPPLTRRPASSKRGRTYNVDTSKYGLP